MENPEDDEDFTERLNDIDADEVALDLAVNTVVEMFRKFQKQGLSISEAAILTAEMLKRNSGPDDA